MSEEDKPVRKLGTEVIGEVISEPDAKRFLAAKMPAFKCVGCGEQDFDLFVERHGGPISQTHLYSRVPSFIPAINYACGNCGMLYSVYWYIIKKWIDANPGEV